MRDADDLRGLLDGVAAEDAELDDPGLAMGWNRAESAGLSLDDYRSVVATHVAAINVVLIRRV